MDGLSATRFVVTNVPWDNTYRHVMWFGGSHDGTGTTTRRNAYFETLPKSVDVSDFNFVKFGQGFVDVQRSWNVLRQNNYIWWINSSGGATGTRPFYAFITGLEVLNTRVTRIYYELDVMQSFGAHLNFRQSFVEQRHLTSREEWSNREPQGLNIGDDYVVFDGQSLSDNNILNLIIVTKQQLRPLSWGNLPANASTGGSTFNGVPDSLCYYCIPFTLSGTTQININGVNYNRNTAIRFMEQLSGNTQLAQQAANNIVSMYVIPGVVRPGASFNVQNIPFSTSFNFLRLIDVRQAQMIRRQNIRRLNPQWPQDHIFQTYPYLKYVLSDGNGGTMELKPDLFGSRTEHIVEWHVIVGATPISMVVPIDYGIFGSVTGNLNNGLTRPRRNLEMMNGMYSLTQNETNFPNDMLAAFIQGNKNQVKAQQASNYEDLRFKQAVRGFNYGRDQLANATNTLQSGLGVAKGLGTAAVGGIQAAMSFGVLGLDRVTSGLNQAVDNGFGVARGIQNSTTLAGNNQLSQFGEYQEYAQKMRGILAQKQDLDNLPPNTTIAHNNLNLLFSRQIMAPSIFYQRPRNNFLNRINSYHHFYGQIYNNFETPNLTLRPFWNYIRMGQANITGDVPEMWLAVIRQIFEQGVTLWRSDMYNYNRGNR